MDNLQKPYDYAVFIGRLSPPHNAHFHNIRKGLEVADQVIVFIGSAYRARNLKHPFTWQERAQMLSAGLTYEENKRVIIRPLRDFIYNDSKWTINVQQEIDMITNKEPSNIALVGHAKDKSSYYLTLFPQWDFIEAGKMSGYTATDIRNKYFNYYGYEDLYFNNVPKSFFEDCYKLMPNGVIAWLNHFSQSDEYKQIQNEYSYIRKYKEQWKAAPHPVNFVTTDAVVIQSGHILLVKRKAFPGKGLWALPGGFLKTNELIHDGMLRELKEETRIKIDKRKLSDNIKIWHVFDNPERSERGRTITHAALIHLPGDKELPQVKGGDDASHAFWMPLTNVKSDSCFEDHSFIIEWFVNQLFDNSVY